MLIEFNLYACISLTLLEIRMAHNVRVIKASEDVHF